MGPANFGVLRETVNERSVGGSCGGDQTAPEVAHPNVSRPFGVPPNPLVVVSRISRFRETISIE
jgi:hypothetical protein